MRAVEFVKPKFKIDKKKNKLSVTLILDNKIIGQYQYDNNSNRHLAEVIPEYKGKGYGKLLLLKALEVANDLGFEFIEDESRTSEYENLVDSLENSGYVVRDDDQIYLTQNGLEYLNSATKDFTNEDTETSKNLAWRIRFKRFSGLDSLMPEREGKVYLMPIDKSALRTFNSLTGKDYEKIRNMPTEVYTVDDNAMVGDMRIINQIFSEIRDLKQHKKIMDRPENAESKQKSIDFIKELRQSYIDTRVPFGQYKQGMFTFPEILADPSQIRKLTDKGITYDKNTGEIKLTKR